MDDRTPGGIAPANDIAIVGMAAHLPGAASVEAYWANLRDGVESIRSLTEDELIAAGESVERMRRRNYVPAAATLDRFEEFDAEFFGFSPKEAAILDPQHRQFLEVAWEALENAGHMPDRFDGAIGVWAGCGMGSYFYFNICSNPDLVENTGMFLLRHTGNDKDFLSTRVSHVFDLKGPSINLQTACSTSLVAAHYACQALLTGECDMALAGGVTIELPHGRGYLFQDGEILSPDGHCHAFDHRAEGTVFGSGAGCVVLRRLSDAIRDGDHIWAVIKGTAVNNDGAAKAGYLAPSVDGQAACVAEAQALAGVSADTVTYVECHGTGTYLGDPIEVSALTAAFRETTTDVDFCKIGSVKTNIGHLDTAAGVASLIKTALALHHRQIPPSLGYEAPNPAIAFEGSPFRVNATLTDWQPRHGVRRAGVNSLGVGGTNAHAVLEEAPPRVASDDSDWPFQPLVLSARSKAALDQATARLAAHLTANPDQPLADVAWTLKEGRRAFDKRRVVVAESHDEAARLLLANDTRRVFSHDHLGDDPEVVFLLPGGGAQYPNMARDLYETEPVFRDWMDRGLAVLKDRFGQDLQSLWLPEPGQEAAAAERLKQPSQQLPLIMITEYALAQLLMSWGVRPAALIGHSMGENTAAALAGVMSFEDCIGLVSLRGQLFDTVPAGGMLSVPLSQADLRPRLTGSLDMASVNAPGLCVVSGPDAALNGLAAKLSAEGIETQRIAIDIAAHSRMLKPILARFRDYLRSIPLAPPRLPVISNRTGRPLTAAEATDPDYWVGHLRNTVMFADGIAHLKARPGRVYVEVGPGKALASLAQANGIPTGQVINAMRHPDQEVGDDLWFITTLMRLWACGVAIDWDPIWGEARRNRVPLPGYSFQRKPYFIAPGKGATPEASDLPMRIEDLSGWGWQPHWRPRAAECEIDIEAGLDAASARRWLVFADEAGLADAVVARLRDAGHDVVTVTPGDRFGRLDSDRFTLAPEQGRDGYDRLIRDLVAEGRAPDRVAHFWLATTDTRHRPGSSFFHRVKEQGFWALFHLAQAWGDEGPAQPLHLVAVTTGAAQVRAEPLPHPEKALMLGPLRVMPRELPGVTCAQLDLVMPTKAPPGDDLVIRVLEDLLAEPGNTIAALRGSRRLEQAWRPAPLPPVDPPLRQGACVLITGGFGGIGQSVAADLADRIKARLVLVSRQPLPDRATADDAGLRRIEAVEALTAAGAEVLTLAADICNIEEMQAVRAAAEARFGRIDAVIHAAGTIDDGPLLTKSVTGVEAVLAPKVLGTEVLTQVFPDGTIDRLVLFSSSSTVTAPAGQVDYVAANAYLNAVACSMRGGKTRVTAVDWGIWTGVGMAAEAMAARTGAAAPALRRPVAQPLLSDRYTDNTGRTVLTGRWRTRDLWPLDGHRTRDGQALLPGTGYLELAAEALAAEGAIGPFEIRDLSFLRPLQTADEGERLVEVRLTPDGSGRTFEVRAAARLGGRTGTVLHAQGYLATTVAPAPPALNLDAIGARCPEARAADPAGLQSPQEDHLSFGPRWRVLREVAYGRGEALARMDLPAAFASDPDQGWRLHPALLDIATGWAMRLISGYAPTHLWVPVRYGTVRVHAPLPARIASWVRNAGDNRADQPHARFDITLTDPEGRILVEIEGFQIQRLDGAFAAPPLTQRDLDPDEDNAAARPLSAAEERLAHNLSQGIRPAEGAEALMRAMATGLPQVVVSSLDLSRLIAQTEAAQIDDAGPGTAFQRPDLDSDFVAPRTGIEQALADIWRDLLGVAQVGVEDSFFDLGGHSLIAVRLFSQIRKTWGVDLPISVLLEAPTIAGCAALIAAEVGGDTALDGAEAPVAAPTTMQPARRFTHLVPMQTAKTGAGTPFFLVAGMFGNVLNLRHLAELVGGDRPFYGLQARGLYGDQAPHMTFPEAATDMIAEMREVQPQGPYMVGGFSGGGLTAWEIARQLEEAREEVALTVLLDTPLPMRPVLTRADRAIIKLTELRRKGPAYLAEWARARIEWERIRRAGPAPEGEGQFHNAAIEAAFRAALPVYDMPVRSGRTLLFRPPLDLHWKVTGGRWVSAAKEYVYPDNDWGRFAPGLEVIEVPGDHDSMVLEPNVRVLAARLRRALAAADSGDRTVPQRTAAE